MLWKQNYYRLILCHLDFSAHTLTAASFPPQTMITNKTLNQFLRLIFVFMYVYVEVGSAMCVQVPDEARRGNQMPFT